MRRHELSDEQFKKIEHMLPGRKGHVGVTAQDNRVFVNGKEKEVWQRRFWEHIIRDEDDWQHSSFNHWVEKGLYEKSWGAIEPITFSGMGEAE